jgi:hypothetical protein
LSIKAIYCNSNDTTIWKRKMETKNSVFGRDSRALGEG